MEKIVKAKYKNGVLELLEKVDLSEGAEVKITISFELSDISSEEEKRRQFLSAAGGWKDLLDCEQFLKEVYEFRKIHTRPEVKL